MGATRRTILRRITGIGGLVAGGALGRTLVTAPDRSPRPTALVAGSLQGVAERFGGATVEAHGSVAIRRFLLDNARHPDAVVLADPTLFSGLTDGYVRFATNALVLAYSPASPFASAIRTAWWTAIGQSRIAVGRTDPELDPLGYRTVMALELADRLDLDPGGALDRTLVFPETALMRTLETGELDAAFAYRNMAIEHDLPYVDLPTTIDFSDPTLAATYGTVSYDLADRTVRGAPIVYGAAGLTDPGRRWVRSLTRADGLLARAGLAQPDGLPDRRTPGDQ